MTEEWFKDQRTFLDQAVKAVMFAPPEERATLASELIESLEEGIDNDAEAAWSLEIRRRLERLDAGLAKTVPWAEARRRILTAAGLNPDA